MRGDVNAVKFAEFVDLTFVAKVELVLGNVLGERGHTNNLYSSILQCFAWKMYKVF